MKPAQARLSGLRFLRGLNIPWSNFGWGLLIAAILFGILFLAWKNNDQRSRTDFEGTVVERWAVYSETQEGSRPRLRLIVEAPDSERFTVNVEPDVYESARIGMHIKSKAGQVVLLDSEQRTTGRK